MKNIILILLFSLLLLSSSFAEDLPNNFREECYSKYYRLEVSDIDLKKTYKLNIDRNDIFLVQGSQLLPFKLYEGSDKLNDYKINLTGDQRYLTDDNYNTYLTLDTSKNRSIEIELEEKLEKGTFDFNFSHNSVLNTPRYYISSDGKRFFAVSKSSIGDFDIKSIKIDFISTRPDIYEESINITKLSFENKGYTFLFSSLSSEDIEIFSDYRCSYSTNSDNLTTKKYYQNFSLDKDTEILSVLLGDNPKLDTYIDIDTDSDWVDDSEDNCVGVYNPDQADNEGDGKGDLCMDDDDDGIIGYKDNCPLVYNPDQKDVNANGVGDVCEFDKDEDGIFDSKDNCINIYNPDQKDTDRDGIGDACDNCEYYNPSQRDKDNNGVGDICDQRKEKLQENDKDKDGVIDWLDNCKDISNPDQEDTDNDGIGDVCDNCKSIQNKDQLDLDKNGVGDMCEDSDKDGIEGYLDNCINIYNPEQADQDNDGIGDMCEDDDYDGVLFAKDNCPYDYNPDQMDIDKDGQGDICDENDDRFIESNKTFFIGLMIFITFIFAIGIVIIVKKLPKIEEK